MPHASRETWPNSFFVDRKAWRGNRRCKVSRVARKYYEPGAIAYMKYIPSGSCLFSRRQAFSRPQETGFQSRLHYAKWIWFAELFA